jgi:hypothetical protein
VSCGDDQEWVFAGRAVDPWVDAVDMAGSGGLHASPPAAPACHACVYVPPRHAHAAPQVLRNTSAALTRVAVASTGSHIAAADDQQQVTAATAHDTVTASLATVVGGRMQPVAVLRVCLSTQLAQQCGASACARALQGPETPLGPPASCSLPCPHQPSSHVRVSPPHPIPCVCPCRVSCVPQVLLYAYLPYKQVMRWEFVGRIRSHHGPIASLVFGESPSGQTRLLRCAGYSYVPSYLEGSLWGLLARWGCCRGRRVCSGSRGWLCSQ